jgi:hypothetical protein
MSGRVRLITMAWGESYIRQLFDYALPAVLAPGNLPVLAEQFECEMVIVTSENWFAKLREHPVYRRIARLCPIELRPIDEFINRPDAYGMALTHALFRGFEELGAAMLDTHLIFFNADFIMADGSLRSVARKIEQGERLILSPSYCVMLEEVAPQLTARRTSGGEVLAIAPREMAAIALRHRHNTIRGKTVNQRLFSMEWIDQFYWLVDERTLIAHQLPIAVVGMRPTRVLTEMRTYWDYGIISEACHGVEPCVLADSDDFQMIELRRAETARDQISLGWPTPREIAEKLQKFITRDPISLARHTLVLHSADLPADLGRAKAELDAYVETVLRELPTELADHIDHPNWAYHYPRFQQARRKYLIQHGMLEEPRPLEPEPPTAATEGTAPAVADAPLAAPLQRRTRLGRIAFAVYRRVFGLAPDFRPWHPRWGDVQPVLQAIAATERNARVLVVSSEDLPERLLRNLAAEHVGVREIVGVPTAAETDDRQPIELLMGTTAAETPLPRTAMAERPSEPASSPPALLPQVSGADGIRVYRMDIEHDLTATIATATATATDTAPRAIRLRSLHLTWQQAEDLAAGEASEARSEPAVAALGNSTDMAPNAPVCAEAQVPRTAGPAALLSSEVREVRSEPVDGAEPTLIEPVDGPPVTEEFDLCLCEINGDDLMNVRLLVRRLAPRLRRGGSILVLHFNHLLSGLGNMQALILSDALALDLPCRFHFSGSKLAAKALLGFAAAINDLRSRRPAAMARGAVQLAKSMLRARRANRIAPAETGRPHDFVTSFVIEISVTRHAAAPVRAALVEELLQAAK